MAEIIKFDDIKNKNINLNRFYIEIDIDYDFKNEKFNSPFEIESADICFEKIVNKKKYKFTLIKD